MSQDAQWLLEPVKRHWFHLDSIKREGCITSYQYRIFEGLEINLVKGKGRSRMNPYVACRNAETEAAAQWKQELAWHLDICTCDRCNALVYWRNLPLYQKLAWRIKTWWGDRT